MITLKMAARIYWHKIVQRNYRLFIENIEANHLLDYLIQAGVLQVEDSEIIKFKPTRKLRIRELLFYIMKCPASQKPVEHFLEALTKDYDYLSRMIAHFSDNEFSSECESDAWETKGEYATCPERVFSGIQPTGIPHIGNYLGAIQHWVELQKQYNSLIFSVVDMHSITMPQDPATLRENIRDQVTCLLACGIDPEKCILFQQSDVSQHAELAWVLGCVTTMATIQHLPQYKEKSKQQADAGHEVGVGLFTYPILQSADILLYKSTHVPVGEDQQEHIQLTQHLARVFNHHYGSFFPRPKMLLAESKRIKNLRKPLKKMSKSDSESRGRIEIIDSPEQVVLCFKKAVTDSTSRISHDPEGRPGVTNLIDIHTAFSGLSIEEICEKYKHIESGEYKMVVADSVNQKLAPIREEYFEMKREPGYVDSMLKTGADKARSIAEENFIAVKKLIGFL